MNETATRTHDRDHTTSPQPNDNDNPMISLNRNTMFLSMIEIDDIPGQFAVKDFVTNERGD